MGGGGGGGERKRDMTETSEMARRDLSLPSRISIKVIDFQPVGFSGKKLKLFSVINFAQNIIRCHMNLFSM